MGLIFARSPAVVKAAPLGDARDDEPMLWAQCELDMLVAIGLTKPPEIKSKTNTIKSDRRGITL
jgi:hypothetical protein